MLNNEAQSRQSKRIGVGTTRRKRKRPDQNDDEKVKERREREREREREIGMDVGERKEGIRRRCATSLGRKGLATGIPKAGRREIHCKGERARLQPPLKQPPNPQCQVVNRNERRRGEPWRRESDIGKNNRIEITTGGRRDPGT